MEGLRIILFLVHCASDLSLCEAVPTDRLEFATMDLCRIASAELISVNEAVDTNGVWLARCGKTANSTNRPGDDTALPKSLAAPYRKVRAEVLRGFARGYAHSARIVCHFRGGPRSHIIDYQEFDPDANYIGMRNFFVAVRLYGKNYACEDALSAYGPQGMIRGGFLEK